MVTLNNSGKVSKKMEAFLVIVIHLSLLNYSIMF